MTGTAAASDRPDLTDLIAGHVEIFVAVISTAVPQVKAGKARARRVCRVHPRRKREMGEGHQGGRYQGQMSGRTSPGSS